MVFQDSLLEKILDLINRKETTMILPQKIIQGSITEVKIYLNKHLRYKSVKNQILIKELITQKEKKNQQFVDNLYQCPLSILAGVELLKERKKEKEILADPMLVIDKMIELLNKAEEHNQFDELKEYIKRHK